MTDLRTAAQQALEALEAIGDEWGFTSKRTLNKRFEAVDALRAALAEPVQEPVAWTGYDLDAMVEAFDRVIEAHFSKAHPFHDPTNMDAKMALRILRGFIPAMKAYTAPPQRTPLTEEEILSLFRTSGSPTVFARAIERAYGIG